jgi:hypothetical protein
LQLKLFANTTRIIIIIRISSYLPLASTLLTHYLRVAGELFVSVFSHLYDGRINQHPNRKYSAFANSNSNNFQENKVKFHENVWIKGEKLATNTFAISGLYDWINWGLMSSIKLYPGLTVSSNKPWCWQNIVSVHIPYINFNFKKRRIVILSFIQIILQYINKNIYYLHLLINS